MKNRFVLGQSSSIEGAIVNVIFRDGEFAGHEILSYRGHSMGVEIGNGCVLFTDPLENEELYKHMDWVKSAPYRESSIRQLREKRS